MVQQDRLDPENSRTQTIGLLVSQLEPVYQGVIWQSCAEAAKTAGVNLVVFVGGTTDPAPNTSDPVQLLQNTSLLYDTQGNFVYDLATPDTCDGLIIVTSSLGSFSTLDSMIALCQRYAPMPVVSFGLPIPGINSVICDSSGIRDAVTHQIEDHGHRKIAFIRGPEHHAEAEERFANYREALQSHGISFDPSLSAPGDYLSIKQSTSAIQRWLRQGVQSIITANDTMALDLIRYLQSLGVKVPYDMAVIGYDDRPTAKDALPALTTVRQPLRDMVQNAVDILLAQFAGETQITQRRLASRLILRQSCGCISQFADVADIHDPVDYLVETVGRHDPAWVRVWADQLMRTYNAALKGEITSEIDYSHSVEKLIYELVQKRVDLSDWLHALTELRRSLRQTVSGQLEHRLRVEHLWDVICYTINNVGIRKGSWDIFDFEHDQDFRNFVTEEILATYDAQHLERVLQQYLPHLGVPNSYLVAFPETQSGRCDIAQGRCVVNTQRNAKDRTAAAPLQTQRSLLPAGILAGPEPYHIVIQPLYSQTTKLGYAAFEVGNASGEVYHTLRSELSSALMSMQLVQQLTNAYIEVEERVVSRTSELLEQMNERARVERAREAIYEISEAARNSRDMNQLYPQIHAIVARLLPAENLYIAQVDDETQMISFPYFVDEHDEQPAPRPIDSPTITSQVIQRQEPLLVDPDTFDDLVDKGVSALIGSPSLDWMGVPLTLQGHTFGALVVQTYEPSVRYSREDLDLLMFVSDQIALAINRVQTEAERSRLVAVLQRRTAQLVMASEITRLTSALRDVQQVMDDAVALIQQRFDFYFTGIYLIERTPPCAVLRAGSGDTGQEMLPPGDILDLDGSSMISWCIVNAQARLANDVEQDNKYRASLWLPDTRSELDLPLLTAQGCIGAVTMQSTALNAFGGEEIQLLQALVDHIAIAIENAVLHERIRTYTNELESQVAARTAALQAANKELSTFAYSVSHDLRAPLRRIDGFSEAVIQDFSDDLPQMARDYLSRVRQSVQQMNTLIEALLELSRVTQSEIYRTDVDLSGLAREITADFLQHHPRERVHVQIADNLHVHADPRLLHIVMDNLIGNACKFTRKQDHAHVEFGRVPDAETATYYIRDNGVGFDPQYKERLFAPFQRLHSEEDYEGTGIGLATVQRIIHRHGGRIWADSEPGAGATFYFTLGDTD